MSRLRVLAATVSARLRSEASLLFAAVMAAITLWVTLQATCTRIKSEDEVSRALVIIQRLLAKPIPVAPDTNDPATIEAVDRMRALSDSGKDEAAIGLASAVLSIHRNAVVYWMRGQVYRKLGRRGDAIADFESAYTSDPRLLSARVWGGLACAESAAALARTDGAASQALFRRALRMYDGVDAKRLQLVYGERLFFDSFRWEARRALGLVGRVSAKDVWPFWLGFLAVAATAALVAFGRQHPVVDVADEAMGNRVNALQGRIEALEARHPAPAAFRAEPADDAVVELYKQSWETFRSLSDKQWEGLKFFAGAHTALTTLGVGTIGFYLNTNWYGKHGLSLGFLVFAFVVIPGAMLGIVFVGRSNFIRETRRAFEQLGLAKSAEHYLGLDNNYADGPRILFRDDRSLIPRRHQFVPAGEATPRSDERIPVVASASNEAFVSYCTSKERHGTFLKLGRTYYGLALAVTTVLALAFLVLIVLWFAVVPMSAPPPTGSQ